MNYFRSLRSLGWGLSVGTLGFTLLGELLGTNGAALAQTPPAPPTQERAPTALDRLKSSNYSTGRLKETDLTAGKIPAPAALVPNNERPVIKTASAVQRSEPAPGFINAEILESQISQRKRELDACLPAGTQAVNTPPVQLHFTIMPGGHTKNTVVMTERRPNSLEMVKCVRRRMDAWVFTSPAGGAIEIESSHDFARAAKRAPSVATVPPAEAGTLTKAAAR